MCVCVFPMQLQDHSAQRLFLSDAVVAGRTAAEELLWCITTCYWYAACEKGNLGIIRELEQFTKRWVQSPVDKWMIVLTVGRSIADCVGGLSDQFWGIVHVAKGVWTVVVPVCQSSDHLALDIVIMQLLRENLMGWIPSLNNRKDLRMNSSALVWIQFSQDECCSRGGGGGTASVSGLC